MFSTTAPNGMTIFSNCSEEIISSVSTQPLHTGLGDTNVPVEKEYSTENDLTSSVDIPVSNEFHENKSDNLGLERYSLSSYEPYDPIVISGLSSLSASLQKAVGFHQSMSTYHGYNGENTHNNSETSVQDLNSSEAVEVSFDESATKDSEDHMQLKDDITTVMDSESILVLMSRRNVTRGITCKQSCLSCIKFYRNFDVPLGKFLRENLLNQNLLCGTCNELTEAHLSYYAHHNKQLTIQVKRVPLDKNLPGEKEGKLWMWSCCGQCRPCNGNLKSTKRVLVSVAARGLSFGKFLELGFSNHSSWEIPSTCGHSFYGDYFHFFGLGSMVAMFRYSTVATYAVSLPLWKVKFSDSIEGDFLKEEVEDVCQEGISMFAEVENSLKKIETKFVGSMLNIQGSFKRFADIREMLKQEQEQFQVDMKNLTTFTSDASVNKWLYKPLNLNHIQWELLLQSYIWDERLHSLLSSDLKVIDPQTNNESVEKQSYFQEKNTTDVEPEGLHMHVQSSEAVSINIPDPTEEKSNLPFTVITAEGDDAVQENGFQDDVTLSTQLGTTETIATTEDITRTTSDVMSEFSSLVSLKLADPKGWMWTPFSQIRNIYLNDLQRGYLPKYEPINSYPSESSIYKMITENGSKLHFPLGSGNHLVSDYEDELSSMIACALAFLKDGKVLSEDLNEDYKFYESSQNISSLSSSNWSSFSSMDTSDFSSVAISSEELRFSSFDRLELLDSVASSRLIHPTISMGRLGNRAKYSVACLFAKDFLNLRNQCGLSELDYISSLSRCKPWDAKGGKSKSFFAKTLDDRFIVKEIKKTEFCSFLEFASDYFGYMNQCFKLGNQTCLAKILGIYQVKKVKSGAKHDLMVMENLTYSRKLSRQYDLKGALYSRFNAAVDGAGDVLLDQNFVNDMNVSPLYVNTKAKRKLQRAVWNDTAFLNSINVMDYSLLVGVDVERKELVCGIIDYVRQYTWDKQLENWVKSFVVPKNHLPTILSPKEYKKRFRKFIDTHFFSVPDDWCSQRSSNRCSLCGMASHSKS